MCEQMGSTVKVMQIRIHIRCVWLKAAQRGSDWPVFDIKVPLERFEGIRNRLYGTLMSYTDWSAHLNKAKT